MVGGSRKIGQDVRTLLSEDGSGIWQLKRMDEERKKRIKQNTGTCV